MGGAIASYAINLCVCVYACMSVTHMVFLYVFCYLKELIALNNNNTVFKNLTNRDGTGFKKLISKKNN